MVRGRQKSTPHGIDIDWQKVGRRIRELRGFDITQEEFAKRIRVSQNYLSVMEHGGAEVGAGILLAISREFGKSLEMVADR